MTLEFVLVDARALEPVAHDGCVSDRVQRAGMVTIDFVVPAAVGGTFADLVAEFAAWVPLPMDRRHDGSFHTAIRLATGASWRYRLLVDGDRWINDWDAHDYVVNDDGGCLSVVRT